ncbi:MAG: hypothetical protein M3Z05_23570, partial [Gemmatimonadota bacterium]|nr:hypothetical protein [Gemmatimonadota bacterium]
MLLARYIGPIVRERWVSKYADAHRLIPSVRRSGRVARRSKHLLWPIRLFGALCAVASASCESVLLETPQYASVSVSATDASGIGIPDLSLQLYTRSRVIAYGTTDSGGRYKFTDVAPGGYGVLLVLPDRYKEIDSNYAVMDNLTVAARTIEPVRFTLTECRGVIDATATELVGASAQGVN